MSSFYRPFKALCSYSSAAILLYPDCFLLSSGLVLLIYPIHSFTLIYPPLVSFISRNSLYFLTLSYYIKTYIIISIYKIFFFSIIFAMFWLNVPYLSMDWLLFFYLQGYSSCLAISCLRRIGNIFSTNLNPHCDELGISFLTAQIYAATNWEHLS